MKRLIVLLALVGVLAGCGATPEPTEAPPTQTPWIIVVTATPGSGGLAEAQPTQTPLGAAPTPTRPRKPLASPTVLATVAEVTGEPMATVEQPTPTVLPSTATDTPEPGSLKYPAPELVDPPNGVPVGWKGTVTLVWRSVGELAEDEYYHVHLDRPPKTAATPWYGDYILTKDTKLLVEQSFLAPFHLAEEHGRAEVYWWVRVVRKTGEDRNGKPIGVDVGLPSEKRYFVVEPRPGGP